MARMKFLCDADRCIECNGCVTACKNEHEVPWGVNRRRVVTLDDGQPGEKSISVACMHCTDAPCQAVCPVDCFYTTDDGIVLHDKNLCIGCGYCFYACPFGAPQYPQQSSFGARGKMDKCTFCAGGPEDDMSQAEFEQYGRNRIAEGSLPLCAEIANEYCVVVVVLKPGVGKPPTKANHERLTPGFWLGVGSWFGARIRSCAKWYQYNRNLMRTTKKTIRPNPAA